MELEPILRGYQKTGFSVVKNAQLRMDLAESSPRNMGLVKTLQGDLLICFPSIRNVKYRKKSKNKKAPLEKELGYRE